MARSWFGNAGLSHSGAGTISYQTHQKTFYSNQGVAPRIDTLSTSPSTWSEIGAPNAGQ